LNGAIEKGPNRLNDLFAILLRFRRFQYALVILPPLVFPVSKVFLSIVVVSDDHKFWNANCDPNKFSVNNTF
jgi:hypothetical protein